MSKVIEAIIGLIPVIAVLLGAISTVNGSRLSLFEGYKNLEMGF